MRHEKRIGQQRKRRAFSVRNRIRRDATRPRLSVFRSGKHIYAQVIDDEQGKTLASAGTLDKELREKLSYGGNIDAAKIVGQAVAQRAIEAGVKAAVFDRREYRYHGRVAAVADAARDAGLDLGAKKVVPEKPAPKAAKAPKATKEAKAAKEAKASRAPKDTKGSKGTKKKK